jgi:tRNA (guanine37-N1)-methyltransferase
MKVTFISLFPDSVRSIVDASILGRAQKNGALDVAHVQIRDYALDKHRTVDDTPVGGGAGMVMRVDVVARAIAAVRADDPPVHVVLVDARGRPFDQQRAHALSAKSHIAFVCGRYEGIDARVERLVDEIVCVGDFILTGGELAALCITDAVVRLLPGVLNNGSSIVEESFSDRLLEHHQHTRPMQHDGHDVDLVLQSGDHKKIEDAHRADALKLTAARRPELFVQRKKRRRDDKIWGL